MKILLSLTVLGVVCCGAGAGAEPISYELPPETAEFKPGPGVEVAQANCAACHSADYIRTQPRGAGFGRPQCIQHHQPGFIDPRIRLR